MKNIMAVVTALILSVNIMAQSNIMNQGELISKDAYHEIPISNSHEEIVQYVSLKRNSFKFIFDTGAPLAISKEVQSSINYPILHRVPLKDANNNSDTINIVLVDTIQLGKLVFKNVPAVVIDFKNSPIGCQNIDGIVGSNIARFLIVQFDLNRNKIILTDEAAKINLKNKNRAEPIYLDNQSNAFLEIKLTNTLIDSAHFDSGMGKFYDMNIGKAEQYIPLLDTKTSSIFKGYGISGQGVLGNAREETVHMITADIKLGSSQIDDAQIGSTQAASRIGRELLNYGTLTIDYLNSQYWFDKYPKRLNNPRPNFGFTIITENSKVTVGVVWENTFAQKYGFRPGVEIISINNKVFQNLTACEIETILLKEFSKNKLKIKYIDNGVIQNKTIKEVN